MYLFAIDVVPLIVVGFARMSVSMSWSSDDSSSGSAVTSQRNTWLEVAQLSLNLAAQLASASTSSA
jgi:hypothetical protein